MIKIIDDDIFNTDCDVILHQVNCQGVMGSGVAFQVRKKYPNVYKAYREYCNSNKDTLLGSVLVCDTGKGILIGNLFSQDNFGFSKRHTDYNALKECLKKCNNYFKGKRVAIPYFMSCFRGGGDWNVVNRMIEEELCDCKEVVFYRKMERKIER